MNILVILYPFSVLNCLDAFKHMVCMCSSKVNCSSILTPNSFTLQHRGIATSVIYTSFGNVSSLRSGLKGAITEIHPD